jgi:uncharacterized protein YjbI with pentapeptide repeats
VCFDGADLRWAKLGECVLTRASFRGADLTSASLWSADCTGAIFDQAILNEADFDLTNLDGASFKGAKVRKAIFPHPQLAIETVMDSVRNGTPVRMSRRDERDGA